MQLVTSGVTMGGGGTCSPAEVCAPPPPPRVPPFRIFLILNGGTHLMRLQDTKCVDMPPRKSGAPPGAPPSAPPPPLLKIGP